MSADSAAAESVLGAVQSALGVHANLPRDANETTTRVAVIDAILTALGWKIADISREAPSGAGDFLDYVLRVDGQPWMVVEAKRKGAFFEIDPAPPVGPHRSSRAMQGFIQRGGTQLRETAGQAARYCNDTGIPLACITNGLQWLFYRGLSRDGKTWQQGNAYVFLTADDISSRFDEFCWCLAQANAGTPWLLERLEATRAAPTLAPTKPIDQLGRLGRKADLGDTHRSEAFDYFSAHFLGKIHVAYGAITAKVRMEHCYVQSGSPGQLDRTLSELILDDEFQSAPEMAEKPEDTSKFSDRLHRYHRDELAREPVLVVGNTGAGKTTYIHRALSELRNREEGAFVAVIDLTDLGQRTDPDHVTTQRRIAEQVLTGLGKCVSVTLSEKMSDPKARDALDPQSFHAFRAMRNSQIETEEANYFAIHGPAATGWNLKLESLFEQFRGGPVEHCLAYIKHLAERYGYRATKHAKEIKRPVLVVLDNVDLESPECQRAAFAFATRVADSTRAIAVVTMREDTFEEARVGKGFLSGSSLRHVHHVIAPSFDALLSARVEFARSQLKKSSAKTKGVSGVHATTDLKAAADWVATVLVGATQAQTLVAGVSGSNMRAALEISSQALTGSSFAVSSPDGSVEHLLDCLFAIRSVRSTEHLLPSLVNCFQPEVVDRPLHALRARLLAYFGWARQSPLLRARRELAETAVGQFGAWGYPPANVKFVLASLVQGRLLAASTTSAGGVRYRLTASGHVHSTLLLRNGRYRLAMAVLTDWYDAGAVDRFVERAHEAAGERGLSIGDLVEAQAVDVFDEYLTRQVTAEDRMLTTGFRAEWLAAVTAAASPILPATAPVATTESSAATAPTLARKRTSTSPAQSTFDLGPDHTPKRADVSLGRLPSPIPPEVPLYAARILWALEFARLNGLGPQRASDIARIFSDHGGHMIQNTNVARGFRQMKDDGALAEWWQCYLRRYTITAVGQAKLRELLSGDLARR